MTKLLWLLRWILKAAIFFTLFAFALNNQHVVSAHFFFGNVWHTPLIVLVLIAFTGGLIVGVLAMVPRWWRQRSKVHKLKAKHGEPQNTQLGDSTQM
jgi:lipopolysaccharide assembly protein A